jgi:hypothetical protein
VGRAGEAAFIVGAPEHRGLNERWREAGTEAVGIDVVGPASRAAYWTPAHRPGRTWWRLGT